MNDDPGRERITPGAADDPSPLVSGMHVPGVPPAAGGEPMTLRPAPISPGIVANSQELVLSGVDIAAARTVLASLGAHGSASLDALPVPETIALLAGLQGVSAALAAVQARALVHLEAAVKEDCRRRDETPRQALRIARTEASRALQRSRSSAGQTMSSCRRLVGSMPGMLAALAEGRVTAEAAHRVGRTVGPASPALRREVDEVLTAHLPYLAQCGTDEWGAETEKVLHGLDPHGAARRHRVARRERSVTVRRAEHGMSVVTARLSALDGARIRKGLSVAAERARAQGDRRGHQQIMADLFADALIGRGDGIDPSTLEVGVIITDRSLLVAGHADAATVEGLGPVPYEHIREEMRRALAAEGDDDLAVTLRRLYIDPDDGQLVGVESRARAFPPALSRFLRLSHQTCRAPYCDAAIRQNDHIVPWSQGGATSLLNGNGLCSADNQKEESGESARVIVDEDGVRRTVEWTSRYGQTARRRAVNFDPLGTARRQQERERRRLRALEPPAEVNTSLQRALERLELRLADLPETLPRIIGPVQLDCRLAPRGAARPPRPPRTDGEPPPPAPQRPAA
ncbi:HNH endonuclease signature motif containing protein [Brachybacterium sp. UNK5269]|uniref:HNH endonuclease signature motif containing protein n=1 Tax=Brachybacterium sp. UNK5269 TaxID=3408576 RepID=UPI003BB067D2